MEFHAGDIFVAPECWETAVCSKGSAALLDAVVILELGSIPYILMISLKALLDDLKELYDINNICECIAS